MTYNNEQNLLLVSSSSSQDRDKLTSADPRLVFDLIRKGRKSTSNAARRRVSATPENNFM